MDNVPRVMNEEQQKALLKTIDQRKGSERDHMIVEVCLNTGLRLNEVRCLDVGDVYDGVHVLKSTMLKPESCKGGKGRKVWFHKTMQNDLAGFLKWKRKNGQSLNMDQPLFLTQRGDRIGRRMLQTMLKYWYGEAGLSRFGFVFHTLRHSFAYRYYKRTQDLMGLQRILGHVSVKITQRYAHVLDDEIEQRMERLGSGVLV